MDSNAFKSDVATPGAEASRATVLLGALLAGIVAMVAVFALDPFGPPVLLVSWALLLGGLLLAVVPGAVRSCGLGLAAAGILPPFVVFLWIWLALSAAALGGTLS